jgi:hypothetical protein
MYLPEKDVQIPLEMRDVISLFHSRTPTVDEVENCEWLMFTSEAEWDPHATDFMERELAFAHDNAYIHMDRTILSINQVIPSNILHEIDIHLSQIPSVYSDPHFISKLTSSFMTNITNREVFQQNSTICTSAITKEDLAKHWGIGLSAAAQTLKVMMQ